jgi:hypothetical protein
MVNKLTYCYLLIVFASCINDKGETIKPIASCIGDTLTTVSFSKHVQPIFDAHCNEAGCHSGASPAGKLNLEASVAYAQLLQKSKGYVDTLNPNYSVLYADMNSTSNPMPPSGRLDACKINLVYKWVQQKAKNN